MIKKIFVLSTIFLMLLFCTACQSEQMDIWDGSTSDAFSGGDGSYDSPYKITTVAELAYLADQVNNGNDTAGIYYTLESDLDLNNIEWTPIGNGTYSFCGSFDGNGNTIYNLKISSAVQYEYATANKTYDYSLAGLFGSCKDASITNLCINGAEIATNHMPEQYMLEVGILCGRFETKTDGDISDIKISNATIRAIKSQSADGKSGTTAALGGAVGYALVSEQSTFVLEKIDSDVSIGSADGKFRYNYMGAIVGYISSKGAATANNLASYLDAEFPFENFESYAGGFGGISISSKTESDMKISNVYSAIQINRTPVRMDGYYVYEAYAIIGQATHGKNSDGSVSGGYEFENLFGGVKVTGDNNEASSLITELYSMPSHSAYAETNCMGCESLPENHEFDAETWDFTDLSRPVLK